MSLEHAPAHRRGYFTSFTLSGTQAGLLIATLVFIPVAALPEDQLLSWGWRDAVLAERIVVAVGLVIRRKLEETPAFASRQARPAIAKMPWPCCCATTGRTCCGSRRPPSRRRSARSSPCGRCRTPSTR